jgi:hypothetical protein
VLGDVRVRGIDPELTFDFGGWRSAVGSRMNGDGTTSMVLVSPGTSGRDFVISERDGARVLIVRDMQHEYVFKEAP